jgi:hypothetical protein
MGDLEPWKSVCLNPRSPARPNPRMTETSLILFTACGCPAPRIKPPKVPAANRLLAPVLLTVPLQLLAYPIAVCRGTRRPAAQSGEIGYG